MPTLTLKCKQCAHKEDVLVLKKEDKEKLKDHKCPKCNGQMSQVPSSFAFRIY